MFRRQSSRACRAFTPAESAGYLDAWANEDTYFPLLDELSWLADAGFSPDVLWRRDGFAVVAGLKQALEPGGGTSAGAAIALE